MGEGAGHAGYRQRVILVLGSGCLAGAGLGCGSGRNRDRIFWVLGCVSGWPRAISRPAVTCCPVCTGPGTDDLQERASPRRADDRSRKETRQLTPWKARLRSRVANAST